MGLRSFLAASGLEIGATLLAGTVMVTFALSSASKHSIDPPVPVPSPVKPDAIVLVVVDTLRADMLSYDGHHRSTTPGLESIVSNGVVFKNAYASSSWTAPSMASLFTSVYPTSHGAISPILKNGKKLAKYGPPTLDKSFFTLAELFREGGYQTVGVATNQYLSSDLGHGQGYDVYYNKSNNHNAKKLNKTAVQHFFEAFGSEWYDAWQKQKSFIWIHYFDPHGPYFPKSPWIDRLAPDYRQRSWHFPPKRKIPEQKEYLENLDAEYKKQALPYYQSEVLFWDHWFAQLAEQMNLTAPNTLFVLTSDHGEEFGEHGGVTHGKTLYEELVRVPLVFYWPAGFEGGRTIETPVSLVDLYPTLADIADLKPPPGTEGKSLVPLLIPRDGDPRAGSLNRRSIFMELLPPKPDKKAIRKGDWKLIVSTSRSGKKKHELFNLADDPEEQNNLAPSHKATVSELVDELGEIVSGLAPPPKSDKTIEIDSDLLEQLENLGYVQ